MKFKYLPLFILPVLLLTSCDSLFGPQTQEIELKAYDLDRAQKNNNQRLSDGYLTSINAKFIKGQQYIPYITLQQYASLYESHFDEDVKSEVSNSALGSTWIIEKGEETCFVCAFDYISREISMAGSIEYVFSEDDETRDLKALNYGLKTNGESIMLSDKNYATYNYGTYNFKYIYTNGQHYFPLGLFDITFSDCSGLYFTYNYKYIYSTRDVDTYSTYTFLDDNQEYTFDSQMLSQKEHDTIPAYLKEYNAKLFIYMMDNFYGLKDNKGIKSMTTYLNNKGFYNDLFASDPDTRTWAFSDSLAILDDNHTALVSVNNTWGSSTYRTARRYGEGCRARSLLRSDLYDYRNEAYREMGNQVSNSVAYSSDGKTALFSFDSFAFGTSSQVFESDGTIKSTAKDYDTFFKMIDVLNRIKEKGTVKNVILDVSLNGGGTIGVMMKLLALISKNNSGYVGLYDDTIGQLSVYTSKVDINGDDAYDVSDCFGNDFNFYILTSDCSYSCGNAFPCIAQAKGYAKIIGQKSGGGECAVSIHYLPNSEYVYHSSNLHLGYYDEENKAFKGFEGGAIPDVEIELSEHSYLVDNLNNAISNA